MCVASRKHRNKLMTIFSTHTMHFFGMNNMTEYFLAHAQHDDSNFFMNFCEINVVFFHVKFKITKALKTFVFLVHLAITHCSSLQRLKHHFANARCANVAS